MNPTQRRLARTALLSLVALAAQPLLAGPVIVNNFNWYEFSFSTPGAFATAAMGSQPSSGGNSQYADAPPWTFNAAFPTLFKITDAFSGGDSFNVFDFGVLVGTTPPVPALNPDVVISDPALALVNPIYSHAIFPLNAGAHSVTISAALSPFNAGAAYFRIDSVPEPSAAALVAIALATIACRGRHSCRG